MDFIVLKRTGAGDRAEDWQPVVIARGVEDVDAAIAQGYTGEGRYKAIEWPAAEDSEFDLGRPGPPPATPVTPRAPEETQGEVP